MPVTMVKKIKADGSPCRKCAEVEARLRETGLEDRIDRVVIADERDPDSEGMVLARQHGVDLAPFFIVTGTDESERVYTVYYRLVKEVLKREITEQEEIADIMDNNPDLDYL
jgi:hypothetical protein